MIGLSTCALLSWCLIIGVGPNTWMGWLRGRPSRRQVGTQHLALLGMAGIACAFANVATMFFVCN